MRRSSHCFGSSLLTGCLASDIYTYTYIYIYIYVYINISVSKYEKMLDSYTLKWSLGMSRSSHCFGSSLLTGCLASKDSIASRANAVCFSISSAHIYGKVRVYIQINTHIHTHTHIYKYIYIFIYISISISVYLSISIYLSIYIYIHVACERCLLLDLVGTHLRKRWGYIYR